MEPVKIGEDRLGGVINATMEGVVSGLKRRQFGKEDLSDREAKYFKVDDLQDVQRHSHQRAGPISHDKREEHS